MGVSPPVRCSARCLIYDIPFYINGRGGRRCYATCTATDDPSAGTEGMGRADGVALVIVHQRLPRVYIRTDTKDDRAFCPCPLGLRDFWPPDGHQFASMRKGDRLDRPIRA